MLTDYTESLKILRFLSICSTPPMKIVGIYGDKKKWRYMKRLLNNEVHREDIILWKKVIHEYKKAQKKSKEVKDKKVKPKPKAVSRDTSKVTEQNNVLAEREKTS